MTGWDGKRIVKGKFQLFDGKSFLPYDYDRATAMELGAKIATREGRPVQVWKNGPSGLVLHTTINPVLG